MTRLATLALLCSALTALPAAAQDLPNLVGTWKGTAEAVHTGPNPYRDAGQPGVIFSEKPIEFTYEIKEQKDRRFAGEMSGGNNKELLLGAFRHDGEGGVMLDNDGEYDFALLDPNTMDLCYRHLNPTSRVVACWTLKRSQ